MNRNERLLIHCTEQELESLIKKSVETTLSTLTNNPQQQQQQNLLTREEICRELHISKTTLWRWSKEGKIPSYTLGNRVYYKKQDVEQSLIKTTE